MFNWAMKPLTDKPSIYANRAADTIDAPVDRPRVFDNNSNLGRYEDFANKFTDQVRGGVAGGIQGVGDLLSNMTSPASIATSLLAGPWMSEAAPITSLGRLGGSVPRVASGIAPSMLPSELVGLGDEAGYNAARGSIYKPPTSVDDLAYDVVRAGKDPIRNQIGGGFNLAEAMAKLHAIRGK